MSNDRYDFVLYYANEIEYCITNNTSSEELPFEIDWFCPCKLCDHSTCLVTSDVKWTADCPRTYLLVI